MDFAYHTLQGHLLETWVATAWNFTPHIRSTQRPPSTSQSLINRNEADTRYLKFSALQTCLSITGTRHSLTLCWFFLKLYMCLVSTGSGGGTSEGVSFHLRSRGQSAVRSHEVGQSSGQPSLEKPPRIFSFSGDCDANFTCPDVEKAFPCDQSEPLLFQSLSIIILLLPSTTVKSLTLSFHKPPQWGL